MVTSCKTVQSFESFSFARNARQRAPPIHVKSCNNNRCEPMEPEKAKVC